MFSLSLCFFKVMPPTGRFFFAAGNVTLPASSSSRGLPGSLCSALHLSLGVETVLDGSLTP